MARCGTRGTLLDDGSGAPIVVVNGKILLELELGRVLATHRAARGRGDGAAARPGGGALGELAGVDAEGPIVGLLGALRPGAEAAEPLMFTGSMSSSRGSWTASRGGAAVRDPHGVHRAVPQRRGLADVVTRDYWWEHSTVQRYLQGGCANVLEGRVHLPYAERHLRRRQRQRVDRCGGARRCLRRGSAKAR